MSEIVFFIYPDLELGDRLRKSLGNKILKPVLDQGEDSFWLDFEACIFDEKPKHEKRPPPPRPFLRIVPEDQLVVNWQDNFQNFYKFMLVEYLK